MDAPIQEDVFFTIPSHAFYWCFFAACKEGKMDILNVLLLCKNLEIDKVFDYDIVPSTASLLAAKCGQLDVIKLLQKHRADITLTTWKGNTAFHLAAKYSHLNVVKYFIENKEFDINDDNLFGESALCKAARDGSLECVKYLIDKGANVLKINASGMSVLYIAVSRGRLDCVKTILESLNINKYTLSQKKINVNQPHNTHGKTGLLLAAELGRLDILKLLEEHQADIDMKTFKAGYTALHLAAKNNHLNVVKYLIKEKGFNINEENIYGCTALSIAACQAALECIQYLIDQGADILHIDNNGVTILYMAVSSGKLDCVEAILKSIPEDTLKTHINHQKKATYFTVLHEAAYKGYKNIVQYLLSKGADPSLKGIRNQTPYDLARNRNIKYLIKSHQVNKSSN